MEIKNDKHKYLILGMGPGETSQARALAKYIAARGEKVIFAIRQKNNLRFVKNDKEFKVYHTELPQTLKKVVEKEKPDIFLLFNSKIWASKGFTQKPIFKKPRICLSVDSNWLFNNKKYYPYFQFNQWMDKYLINLPEKIFRLGLKNNGGGFSIPKKNLKKIIPVGFIPSYKKPAEKILKETRKKYGIKKDEKFIFSYFSGFGAGHRVFAFNNMIKAVDRLTKKGRKIKVLYIGPTNDIDPAELKRNYLIFRAALDLEEYFRALASSDLIFQHQGISTLTQAISVGVPVICNVHMLRQYPHGLSKLHFRELRPFQRTQVCEMFPKSTPTKKISRKIEELLFNKNSREKMIKQQKKILESSGKGEKNVFEIIVKKLL